MIKSIPQHIEKFFEIQQFDLEAQIESPRLSSEGQKSPLFSAKTSLSTKADFLDKNDDQLAYQILSEPSSNAGTAEESKSIEIPSLHMNEMEEHNEYGRNIRLFI